jgi:quinoprotein glucose dehydrogenase
VAKLRLSAAEQSVAAAAGNSQLSGKTRAAALRALGAMSSANLQAALDAALREKDAVLLAEARRLQAQVSPARVIEQSAEVLEKGSIPEKQSALQTLASFSGAEADQLLSRWLDQLIAGKVPVAVQLDLIEAAAQRADPALKQKLAAYGAAQVANNPAAKWDAALEGGDAKAGREIFYEKAEAACMRCHKVNGVGGEVGPDMAGIGALHDRAYLLRAIVEPNAEIAPGYQNVMLTLKSGDIVAGLLKSEDANGVTLTSLVDGKPVTVKTGDIGERTQVPSPMPPGLGEVLGARGLRDVVEYLASLREPAK